MSAEAVTTAIQIVFTVLGVLVMLAGYAGIALAIATRGELPVSGTG